MYRVIFQRIYTPGEGILTIFLTFVLGGLSVGMAWGVLAVESPISAYFLSTTIFYSPLSKFGLIFLLVQLITTVFFFSEYQDLTRRDFIVSNFYVNYSTFFISRFLIRIFISIFSELVTSFALWMVFKTAILHPPFIEFFLPRFLYCSIPRAYGLMYLLLRKILGNILANIVSGAVIISLIAIQAMLCLEVSSRSLAGEIELSGVVMPYNLGLGYLSWMYRANELPDIDKQPTYSMARSFVAILNEEEQQSNIELCLYHRDLTSPEVKLDFLFRADSIDGYDEIKRTPITHDYVFMDLFPGLPNLKVEEDFTYTQSEFFSNAEMVLVQNYQGYLYQTFADGQSFVISSMGTQGEVDNIFVYDGINNELYYMFETELPEINYILPPFHGCTTCTERSNSLMRKIYTFLVSIHSHGYLSRKMIYRNTLEDCVGVMSEFNHKFLDPMYGILSSNFFKPEDGVFPNLGKIRGKDTKFAYLVPIFWIPNIIIHRSELAFLEFLRRYNEYVNLRDKLNNNYILSAILNISLFLIYILLLILTYYYWVNIGGGFR